MLNGVWLISCSLVGDPKTALTIVSHRAFLKFIPVMSNIQRMDAHQSDAIHPVGAGLLAMATSHSLHVLAVGPTSPASRLLQEQDSA
jgi:hypothetical protein